MPTRNRVLTDHQHEAEEAIKLEALRRAAQTGWDHLEGGRYRDVGNDDLEDFIGQLGNRAGDQVRARG
jgi:antitoxin ParD1/3/4